MRTTTKNTHRKKFWNKVLKLELPLFIAFAVIILLWRSSNEIFDGNFSQVITDNFTGIGAAVFLTSVMVSSLVCSIVLVSYDRDEQRKEQEFMI